ncbi:hypothetical protein ACTXT7_013751 [Hymenolepis weldensis]
MLLPRTTSTLISAEVFWASVFYRRFTAQHLPGSRPTLTCAKQIPDNLSSVLEINSQLLDYIMADRKGRLEFPRWMSHVWMGDALDSRCLSKLGDKILTT